MCALKNVEEAELMGMAKLKKCVLMGGLKSVRSVKMENAGKLESVKGLKELVEEERKKREEEDRIRKEEGDRKEIERKKKEEERKEVERKRMEEEQKKVEKEKRRKEEEERKRREEEGRRRKEEEEKIRKEEEERKRREEEERKRKEEEARKRREEQRRIEAERMRKEEEARRRREEERKKREQSTGIPLVDWLLKRKEEEEEREKKELQSNMTMLEWLIKQGQEEVERKRREEMSNMEMVERLFSGGKNEAKNDTNDWSHFAMTETRINTASDLNRAYCYMDAMIIEPHCCNEGELTVLDLSRFVFLRELRVGDECFENVNEVKLMGLKKLEKVVIGKNCFTRYKNGSGLNPNRRFSLMDCEMLTELKIGCYSFSDYYMCKIENVPSLEVIEMGALNESSSVFFYASLELKSVYERMN